MSEANWDQVEKEIADSRQEDTTLFETSKLLIAQQPPSYFPQLQLETDMGEGMETLRQARLSDDEIDREVYFAEPPTPYPVLQAWGIKQRLLPSFAFDHPEAYNGIEVGMSLNLQPTNVDGIPGLRIASDQPVVRRSPQPQDGDEALAMLTGANDIGDIIFSNMPHNPQEYAMRLNHHLKHDYFGVWLSLERTGPAQAKEASQLFVARVALFLVHHSQPVLLPVVFSIDGSEYGYVPSELRINDPWLFHRSLPME